MSQNNIALLSSPLLRVLSTMVNWSICFPYPFIDKVQITSSHSYFFFWTYIVFVPICFNLINFKSKAALGGNV
jgi:hypothetical protein